MAKPHNEGDSEDETDSAEDGAIGVQTGEDAERALGAPEALISELPEDVGGQADRC
jgi:hypothetical protein